MIVTSQGLVGKGHGSHLTPIARAALFFEITGKRHRDVSVADLDFEILRRLRSQPGRTPTGRKRPPFNYPERRQGISGRPKAALLALLLEGCTLEEVMFRFDWPYEQASQAVLNLHRRNGFGLQEGSNGVISLTGGSRRLR